MSHSLCLQVNQSDCAFSEPLPLVSLLHIAFVALRVLLIFPLLVALFFPRVSYVSVQSEEEAVPTASSYLLPPDVNVAPSTGLSAVAGEASKYGTFRSGRSTVQSSGAPTRSQTPAPSTGRKVRSLTLHRTDVMMHNRRIRRKPKTAPSQMLLGKIYGIALHVLYRTCGPPRVPLCKSLQ